MYFRNDRRVTISVFCIIGNMRSFVFISIIFIGSAFVSDRDPVIKTYTIPTQTFDPWVEIGFHFHDTITLDSFVISSQITLGQYQEYLVSVKRDSGEWYYKTQLPDTGMCSQKNYVEYLETDKYSDYPVCGVSWINAMNYCRWRTLKDSLPAGWEYRLPYLEEWLAAYRYLESVQIVSDMNKNYADWLLSSQHEGIYYFELKNDFIIFSDYYHDDPNDPPVLRRKRIIGNSFHMQHTHVGDFIGEYGYSFMGYNWVSFRLIKAKIETKERYRGKPIPKK